MGSGGRPPGWRLFRRDGRDPEGRLRAHKLLAADPGRYDDAALEGTRRFFSLAPGEAIPAPRVDAVEMGTTVGANAFLERHGEPSLLAVT